MPLFGSCNHFPVRGDAGGIDDVLKGQGGHDRLTGGGGNDAMSGAGGNDTFFARDFDST